MTKTERIKGITRRALDIFVATCVIWTLSTFIALVAASCSGSTRAKPTDFGQIH